MNNLSKSTATLFFCPYYIFFSQYCLTHKLTHRIQILVTFGPLFKSSFLIRPSLRHICLFMGPQSVMLNSYILPGEFKVNSSQMWSGPSEREAFVLISCSSAKVFGWDSVFQILLQRNVEKKALAISNCVKVILSESHIPFWYADSMCCNHSKIQFLWNSF